jgi:hypothetical protein
MNTTYLVPGRYWPATLGLFTLMGPVNRLGAWRWYQRSIVIDGRQITERVKIDSQLQPIWPSRVIVYNHHVRPMTLRDRVTLAQVETTYGTEQLPVINVEDYAFFDPSLGEPWEDDSNA